MKQLLQTCESYTVAGLDNRAYLVLDTSSSNDKEVYELLPPPHVQDDDDCVPNEIQAVAVAILSDNQVWCAVSRRNKSLSLYSCCLEEERESLEPRTVHKTTKRVCCLEFARVPRNNNSSSSTALDIIIAGDLTGDATAYPLNKNDNDDDDNDDKSSACCTRLLLGHTGSVLTGVKVNNDKIITSDRDEKIRISNFPQTHIVEGYLLGHTAFVAAMDVVNHCCVTCGGDGTLRLWDYTTTFSQISIVPLPSLPQFHNVDAEVQEKKEQETKEEETGEKEKQDNGEQEQDLVVPTCISMSRPSGKYVAVIFDKCKTIVLYRVTKDQQLEQFQQVNLPSQPLAIRFSSDGTTLLVLVREPDYCLAFRMEEKDKLLFELVPNHATCAALKSRADSDGIVMPTTLVETDRKGKARLKLKEHEDRISQKPWNNVERKQIAKEAQARRHKRKRLQAKAEKK